MPTGSLSRYSLIAAIFDRDQFRMSHTKRMAMSHADRFTAFGRSLSRYSPIVAIFDRDQFRMFHTKRMAVSHADRLVNAARSLAVAAFAVCGQFVICPAESKLSPSI